jgi:hypothetical protein
MQLREVIKTTIKEFLNGNIGSDFNENQKSSAKKLFGVVFDFYLRKVSPKTYPMIYHCTNIENYDSIKKNGLTSVRNYFLDNDNNLNIYGFNEEGEEEPGIACGVNYNDVIDRLYPDPEWLLNIAKKIGNPSKFEKLGIDDRVIFCLWVTDILGLDLNSKISIDEINDGMMNNMINEHSFLWLYVKGKINPDLITIKIHPDLNR